MVFSNAERQRRYRERLKANASVEAVAERARAAVLAGLRTCWDVAQDNNYGDWDGVESFEDVLADLRDPKFSKRQGESVADYLVSVLSTYAGNEDAKPEQAEIIKNALQVITAVTLR